MKTRIAAVALVALLALTGCAGASDAESEQRSTSTESETSAPLVAETPASAAGDDAHDAFLAYVRENLPASSSIPDATDEQLLAAGNDGCSQIAAEVNPDDLTVIEGEERDGGGYYRDSSVIITGARMFLCTEFLEG